MRLITLFQNVPNAVSRIYFDSFLVFRDSFKVSSHLLDAILLDFLVVTHLDELSFLVNAFMIRITNKTVIKRLKTGKSERNYRSRSELRGSVRLTEVLNTDSAKREIKPSSVAVFLIPKCECFFSPAVFLFFAYLFVIRNRSQIIRNSSFDESIKSQTFREKKNKTHKIKLGKEEKDYSRVTKAA